MLNQITAVPRVAAPWQLQGTGYILLFRFSRPFLREQGFLTEAWSKQVSDGFGTVMIVDYQQSNAGPYQELLFIPGRVRLHQRHAYTISKIYVSSLSSVVNGRSNWGIPKELAQFDITSEDGMEQIQIRQGKHTFAEFAFQTNRLSLPVTTAVIPSSFRTIAQAYQGQTFYTAPSGRGKMQPAKLRHAAIDPAYFPDVTQGRLITAVKITNFNLTFPEAEVRPA